METKRSLNIIVKILILTVIMISAISVLFINTSKATIISNKGKFEIFKNDIDNLNWHTIPTKEMASYLLSVWCGQHRSGVKQFLTSTQAHHEALISGVQGQMSYDENNPMSKYTRGSSNTGIIKLNEKGQIIYAKDENGAYIYDKVIKVVKNKDKYTGTETTTTVEKIIRRAENREGTSGLVPDHISKLNEFNEKLASSACCGYTPDTYEGDDQDLIHSLRSSLPGLGVNPVIKSIEFNKDEEWTANDKPGAAFVYTTRPIYQTPDGLPLNVGGEDLTSEQKELGYFDADEKQAALWDKRLNVNIGEQNDWSDRNLGEIAYQYELFYRELKKREQNGKGYEEFVEAYPVDEFGNVIGYEGSDLSSNGVVDYPGQNPSSNGAVDYPGQIKGQRDKEDYIEETKTNIEGKDYKTYVYKDTTVEPDVNAGCFVLGPYCIDYSYNDDTRDIYSSTPTNEVKFNSIEQITVYNQNKQNIEDLGGYFKIAYSYKGEVNEQNEGKMHRISDKEYYVEADYREISGFTSLKPFYIIVYRGSMRPDDFTGFYAKIDFQYLKDIQAEMASYVGNVIHYYYTEDPGKPYEWTYRGSYLKETQEADEEHEHEHEDTPAAEGITVETVEFNLHRDVSSEKSQRMITYFHNGVRIYDTYSIILTSEIKKEDLKFGLYKECSDEEERLYGAKFKVTVEAYGEDLKGKEINKTVRFNKTTNKRGMITISNSSLVTKGLDLSQFTGDVYITFEETKAPAGHVISEEVIDMYLELEAGEVVSSDATNGIDEDNNTFYTYAYNDHGGTPAIQLAKVDSSNGLIKEAYFDVYVAYTDPKGVKYNSDGTVRKYGELIDKQYNIIKGQTKDGYLNLTVEDFKNMPYGFDIKNYTGKITLRITEAGVSDKGYSISSDSISVTLEYQYGILTHYTENTDNEVMVHYLYDDPLKNIYSWAKGETKLYPYLENSINTWVKNQQDKTGKSYEDVLAWLVKYIEDGGTGTAIDMKEWDAGTYTVTDKGYGDGKLVQIVVEDKPGTYTFEDIPEVDRNELTMSIGGYVFLDQTTTKEHEDESDGKMGDEEELLDGIEVALYDAKTGKLAELIQEKDENGKDIIRTNPTITSNDGYYEFNGVDPLNRYYVVFTYNGIEYRATDSSEAKYGSDEWEVSSKGAEVSSGRGNFNTITATTKVYDYYELKGIYNYIAKVRLDGISQNKYPDWNTIVSEVEAEYQDDPEISDKLEYIRKCQATARAGYSSSNPNGAYPHDDVDIKFTTTENTVNEDGKVVTKITTSFAGDTISLLYPYQMQIHLGLVERDNTDLELHSDVVDTVVSINRYDTKYDYDKDLSAYHQYIYEEDYNYATGANNAGIAYYTEDNVHLYITYEIEVTNSTLTPTEVREVVNYYNSEFRWAPEYITTGGNKIKGVQAWYNGEEIKAEASDKTSYGTRGDNNNNKDYKANYINVEKGHELRDSYGDRDQDKLVIHVTYELVGDTSGDSANAREVLKKYLLTESSSDYSKSWAVNNYSEINAYYTKGAYVDTDSHPGNFVIKDFEDANEAYRKAYSDYVDSGYKEEAARNVKLALARLTTIREDDAWKVTETLTNNGIKRTITGSVAEFVNDKVKSSLDLQKEYEDGERYVLYDEDYIKENNLAIEGITVELVELLQEGDMEHGATQVVRAVTKTDENGNYKFESFIAGNYTVRFVYGGYESTDDTIYSKISKNTYEDQDKADFLPINGQYYQSTKANPTTNNNKYWYYSDKEYKSDIKETSVSEERYSDAYDDAFTRITQMTSVIEGAEDTSTSAVYNYDGVIEVESTKHTDPIYAYTSTMELEIEYVRPDIIGNNDNNWYTYAINNVDFGVTPRAYNDMTIGRHVSNIKLYIEGSTENDDNLLLIDANFDENGKVEDYSLGKDIVMDVLDDSWNLDGVINIFYEQIVQQRAHFEVTYTIDVTNDSLYDKDNKIYDTIQYIADNSGKVVTVVYYGEDIAKLTGFETIAEDKSAFVYHNSMTDDGYSKNLNGEDRNQENNIEVVPNGRLGDYNLSTEYTAGDRKIITSKAVNIVDYPNDPLDFIQKNYKGEDVNKHWTSTEPEEFVSSRENYSIADGEITRNKEKVAGEENALLTQSHIIKAATADIPETGVTVSPLLDTLLPGESRTDTLVLQHTLSTATVDITGDSKTTDLTALDEEYSNLIEITRLANSAGKVVDIEGYDITGKGDAETSRVRNIGDYNDEDNTFEVVEQEGEVKTLTPTISTGKSETTVITDPAGVSQDNKNILVFTVIGVAVLTVLATGIVLIKKYVITK